MKHSRPMRIKLDLFLSTVRRSIGAEDRRGVAAIDTENLSAWLAHRCSELCSRLRQRGYGETFGRGPIFRTLSELGPNSEGNVKKKPKKDERVAPRGYVVATLRSPDALVRSRIVASRPARSPSASSLTLVDVYPTRHSPGLGRCMSKRLPYLSCELPSSRGSTKLNYRNLPRNFQQPF